MNPIKTILVDDEPRGLNSLQKLLQMNCPEVEIAGMSTSVMDAREKINQLHPQLVFLDIAMPGKTGFDMLSELDRTPHVIFTTAYDGRSSG